MRNFLWALVLVSTSVMSRTLLLEKHIQSGLILPEYSFTKDCGVYTDGHMNRVIVNGDGTRDEVNRHVAPWRVGIIKTLLAVAKRGTITEEPMPCDGGTSILKGHSHGNLVELDVGIDCGQRRVNHSPATPYLSQMAEDICEF